MNYYTTTQKSLDNCYEWKEREDNFFIFWVSFY